MKIGIYARQLSNLGGSTRHMFAIAETLSKFHPVDVITHTAVPLDKVADRFNMDLSRIQMCYVPEGSGSSLTKLTEQYDLFVNSLFNTYFPSKAKHSAMMVFFPIPVNLSIDARIRYRIANLLNRHLKVFTFSSGVYAEKMINGDAVRHLDNRATITLLPSRLPYRIDFGLQQRSGSARQLSLRLDEEQERVVALPADQSVKAVQLSIPAHPAAERTLTIEVASEGTGVDAHSGNVQTGIVQMLNLQATHPSDRIYRKLFVDWFPAWRDRIENVPPQNFLAAVESYEMLWSISDFTRQWTQTYWDRDSDICYPPVEVDLFPPLEKKQQIVSIGRFFRGSHNKKHLFMIEAFKEMVNDGLEGWTLHLAGGVSDEELHQTYANEVRKAAEGYPIEVHLNLPFDQLQVLYGESALYWHAAGYGENEAREPYKLEHFGMTTVEAMAAGCVPIVIAKGGQNEIVEDGESGFHWHTRDELKQTTLDLIYDSERRDIISKAAVEQSRNFDQEHFEQRLLASLEAHGCCIR